VYVVITFWTSWGWIQEKAQVAPAALLLASEEGGFFVGASLNMNGGDCMI
jgi:3-oxoacyl-[acyl-carrier protein] reductase